MQAHDTLSEPVPPERKRYPALDGVRGLAILLVVVWHYIPCILSNDAGTWAPLVRRIFSTTAAGVDLFFTLSGFLIAGILLEQKGKPSYFGVFYLRRTCRIFPLYFLIFGTFFLASWWLPIAEPAGRWLFANPMPTWSYALFVQNIFMGLRETFGAGWLAVTWSLAVEEQFYLIFPLIVFFLGEKKLACFCILLLIALPFLRLPVSGPYSHFNLPWRADALLIGAVVAISVRTPAVVQYMRDKSGWIILSGLVLLALHGFQILLPGFHGTFEGTFNGLLFGAIILVLRLDLSKGLTRILSCPPLTFMGTLSYGIYMFHQPASGLLHGFFRLQAPRIADLQDAIITVGAGVVAILLAWVSHRYFETPFLRFAHRYPYSSRAN